MADLFIDEQINLDYDAEDFVRSAFNSGMWVTASMICIPYSEMATPHIENSINFIEREGPDCIKGFGHLYLPKLKDEYLKRMKEDYSEE